MESVLAAEATILVELKTIGIVLLVLHCVVVPLLALGASQCDLNAHGDILLKLAAVLPAPSHISKTRHTS